MERPFFSIGKLPAQFLLLPVFNFQPAGYPVGSSCNVGIELIIYFSAHTELEELSKQVGADDFIKKPFVIDHLLALARKYSDLTAA